MFSYNHEQVVHLTQGRHTLVMMNTGVRTSVLETGRISKLRICTRTAQDWTTSLVQHQQLH